jgi:hypothetical protein
MPANNTEPEKRGDSNQTPSQYSTRVFWLNFLR